MKCEHCGIDISQERYEFLIQAGYPITCLEHSKIQKKMVLMEYGHKTAGTVVIVPDDKEQQRKALRAYRRKR